MDLQLIVNLAVGVAVPAIGWLIKSRADTQEEITKLRVKIAEEYVTHGRVETLAADIKSALIRIETKLDGKADKA